jgi:hypothetical protein
MHDWTKLDRREAEWLAAAYQTRARRRLVLAAVTSLAVVAAVAAGRRSVPVRAIVEGQASRNPRHWWRIWRQRTP